jgi:hypothetical protein
MPGIAARLPVSKLADYATGYGLIKEHVIHKV